MKLFKKKIKDGEHLQYHPGTKIISEKMNYKNGKLDGELIYYNEDGSVNRKCIFKNGIEWEGKIIYYSDGNPEYVEEEVILKNGKPHGQWIKYFEDGTISHKGQYEDGKQIGTWLCYHENGKIGIKGEYDNGLMNGEHIYYKEDGEFWKQENYNNGELINKLFLMDINYLKHIESGEIKVQLMMTDKIFGFLFRDNNNEKIIRMIQVKPLIGLQGFTDQVFDIHNQLKDIHNYESGNTWFENDYEKLEYKEYYDLPDEHIRKKGKIIIDDDNIKRCGEWTYYDDDGTINKIEEY